MRQKIGNLFVGGLTERFSFMKPTKAMKAMDNTIIECRFNRDGPQPHGWVFMRQRTDKSFPNSFKTAQGDSVSIASLFQHLKLTNSTLIVAVCESINEPVTNDYLIGFISTDAPSAPIPDRSVALTTMAPPSHPPPQRRPH